MNCPATEGGSRQPVGSSASAQAHQERRGGNVAGLRPPIGSRDRRRQNGPSSEDSNKAAATNGRGRNRYQPSRRPRASASDPPSDRGSRDATRNRAADQSGRQNGVASAHFPYFVRGFRSGRIGWVCSKSRPGQE